MDNYSKALSSKFSIAAFHAEFLKDGCMPLEIIEKLMDAWAKTKSKSLIDFFSHNKYIFF